jgi:hypothetical protein
MSYFTTIFHHTPFASHLQNNLQISLQLNCATAFFAIRKVTEEKITTFLGIPFFKKLYLTIVFLSYLLTTKVFLKN